MQPLKNLNEASLSRVWQHAQSDRPIALLTAFRDEYDRSTNIQRNKELAATLKNSGYGYFYVDGAWIENEGTPEEVYVEEDSIFVIGTAAKEKEFLQLIVSLGKKYNQDGVLVKTSKGAAVYGKDGNELFDVGTLKAGKLASIYTKLRNNKQSNTFVFEGERDGSSFIDRLAQLAGIKK